MKVIDLLNKIANGEEVPNKIRFNNTYWNRICGEKNVYYTNDNDSDLFIYFFRKNLTFTLNDEVEIIEDKKIPEKLSIKTPFDDKEKEVFILKNRIKINEIINKLNEMENNK